MTFHQLHDKQGGNTLETRCEVQPGACVLLLVLQLFLGLGLYHALVRARTQPPTLFRASQLVDVTHRSRLNHLRQHDFAMLKGMMLHDPDLHCAGAPYLRHYVQYAVVRHPNGSFVEWLNPDIHPTLHARHVKVREHSPICYGDASQVKDRVTEVEDLAHHLYVNGTAALCLQHLVDIFQGKWPCGQDGENAKLIPRLIHDDL